MLRSSKWQRVTPKDFAQRVGSKNRLLIFVVQTAIFAALVAVACSLRFDLPFPFAETARLVFALFIWIVVKDIVFHLAKPDRGGWGLVPLSDLPASRREVCLVPSLESVRLCVSLRVGFQGPSTFSIRWTAYF